MNVTSCHLLDLQSAQLPDWGMYDRLHSKIDHLTVCSGILHARARAAPYTEFDWLLYAQLYS